MPDTTHDFDPETGKYADKLNPPPAGELREALPSDRELAFDATTGRLEAEPQTKRKGRK